jgi:hypothetical protein
LYSNFFVNRHRRFFKTIFEEFEPEWEEVDGDWRGLQNEELHNLEASPDIIRVTKSRGRKLADHVTRVKEIRNYTKFWSGNLKG